MSYHAGLPLYEVGKGGADTARCETESNRRTNEMGGESSKKKRKKGNRKKHQSDSESDSECKLLMEAQTRRKKPKTSCNYF